MITGKQINEAKELSKECKITMAEALGILIQDERNEILKRAFVLSDSDSHPSALEAIAMQLGEKEAR
ncbi:hypothetical protein [Allomuricauda sp. F6463D]|uniref:hypothetical protein n=1 Tax=Allomuricauda sp. F6463D TaxID=2926409 RepID=UPI001FF14E77|nr:hypothetical protein [Muricauda sp. F6463D]MCK0159563.1 hypothetical protein [Muricauda sp. F6463D]